MTYFDFLDHSEDYSLDQFFVILSDDDNLQQPELSDYLRDDRYFTCRNCDLTFNSEFEKKLHSETHRILFSCPYCKKYSATTKSDLVMHVQDRHGDLVFCEHCNFYCSEYQKRSFREHQKSHDPLNIYKCLYPNCNFCCRRKRGIRLHVERTHEKKKEPKRKN